MDQVSEIREKTDIVALINSYVPLKKLGQNFKSTCPFHNEKTPSFVVSPERQIWHCFGCGKGGDCYTFLMEYEHIEFPEALRMLADKAGVTLVQKGFDSVGNTKKEQLYKLNALAAEFYHFLLTKHQVGKQALAYLENRKIKPQTINTYMLGFAPAGGRALVRYLQEKKGYKADDLFEAGLVTRRMGKLVDFFHDRLMFPLYDHRGNVIGFSGRVLTPTHDGSKYINTRETLVYHKGSVFFGLNSSKEAIKKENQAIIMEGEFDVIAAFQEGITNTVAIKGTALTEEQVRLIARFANKVTLCLDSDSAGQEAVKRSLPILERHSMTTTAIVIPGGKDPDEAIKTDPIAFKKAAKHDVPVYDVLLEHAIATYSPTTADGKKKIGEDVLPHIARIANEIVKEHYLQLLAKTLNSSHEALTREMEKLAKKEVVKADPVILNKTQRPREDVLEEYLVALIIQHPSPSFGQHLAANMLSGHTWATPAFPKILYLLEIAATGKEFSTQTFARQLPEELVAAFDRCFLLPIPTFSSDDLYGEEVKKIAEELYVLGLKRQIKMISEEIKQSEKQGDEALLLSLQQQLTGMVGKLSKKSVS
jgi:DNA primase